MKKIFIALFVWLWGQSATAAADTLSCTPNQSSYNCLVCNCYHETRGEPKEGMIAVAKTVLSRVENDEFPDTVCGVVFQPSQFSWTSDRYGDRISASKTEDKKALQDCRDTADLAIDEGANGLIYFYNPRKASPAWATPRQTRLCGRAGAHAFLVPAGKTCPTSLGANRKGTKQQQQRRSNGGGSAR